MSTLKLSRIMLFLERLAANLTKFSIIFESRSRYWQRSVNIKNIIFLKIINFFFIAFVLSLHSFYNITNNNGSEPNAKEIELILISDYFKSLFFFFFVFHCRSLYLFCARFSFTLFWNGKIKIFPTVETGRNILELC